MLISIVKTLGLLVPAIVPSWRFFDTIAPSPRIQVQLLSERDQNIIEDGWQDFRPRPKHLPVWKMGLRMFWNYRWNESLFLVSCSECLTQFPTDHSENEIKRHIREDFWDQENFSYACFSLLLIAREGGDLHQVRVYISEPFSLQQEGSVA
ncbi:hypothetical protein [Sneathiella limimaris]|uniref:hypothetical protein n=1 Tax=Sneathiella limimaris TaxID=1964213 RepID=UPI00146C476C|nr:hypothetical protein [Sneathiella limimaris]